MNIPLFTAVSCLIYVLSRCPGSPSACGFRRRHQRYPHRNCILSGSTRIRVRVNLRQVAFRVMMNPNLTAQVSGIALSMWLPPSPPELPGTTPCPPPYTVLFTMLYTALYCFIYVQRSTTFKSEVNPSNYLKGQPAYFQFTSCLMYALLYTAFYCFYCPGIWDRSRRMGPAIAARTARCNTVSPPPVYCFIHNAWVVVRTVVAPPLSVVECGGVRSCGRLFAVLFLSCCCVCDLFLLYVLSRFRESHLAHGSRHRRPNCPRRRRPSSGE